MTTMTQGQMAAVSGGSFWSAVTCGVGIAFLLTAPVIAAIQASMIAIACVQTIVD